MLRQFADAAHGGKALAKSKAKAEVGKMIKKAFKGRKGWKVS